MMKCVYFALLATLLACGKSRQDERTPGNQDANLKEQILINFHLHAAAQETAVNPQGVENPIISVEGCLSGYSTTELTASSQVILYQGDANCLFKLSGFTLDGIAWSQDSRQAFDTWQPGDIAVFRSSTTQRALIVGVEQQLNAVVTEGDAVSYSYREVGAGTDLPIPNEMVTTRHSVTIEGYEAPDFEIAAVRFAGIAQGAGTFVFSLECQKRIVGEGGQAQCGTHPIVDIRYKLVQDTFDSTLTIEQAAALFDEASPAVDPSLIIQSGGDQLPNGGFNTPSGDAILTGPPELHNHPNMLLVLKGSDASYIYFNVDIATTVTTAP